MPIRPRILIVGEALAKSGNGLPFSGRSGERLQRLFGVEGYQGLLSVARLTNLCSGYTFDQDKAAKFADLLLDQEHRLAASLSALLQLVMCGRKVAKAMDADHLDWFQTARYGEWVVLHLFPHPSGLSRFWNDSRDAQRAQDYLRALARGDQA